MKKAILFVILISVFCGASSQSLTYQGAVRKADSTLKKKNYANAAEAYSLAFKINKWQGETDDRYDAACAWALANVPDSAFSNLQSIVGKDYFDYDHLKNDQDLATLHSDSRWQPLLDKTKAAKLESITTGEMYTDFDLLLSSLNEAHTGLYWYSTRVQFDSICSVQRAKIRPGLNSLDFYNIIAPIVAFTKEGHTYLRLGTESQAYLKFNGRYFPCYLKFLDKKAYIINDAGAFKTKGLVLTAINGRSMGDIMQKFMGYEPSDGYNTTSKYRWIEENAKFSAYYAMCYPQTDFFDIEVTDPATNENKIIKHIEAVDYDTYKQQYKTVTDKLPEANYSTPAVLNIDSTTQTAILTFNSFDSDEYSEANMEFHRFVKESFDRIKQQKVKHLIIDIRKNGGGNEGYEDYLLSFMMDKDYLKYKYVQASAFSYSFYQYTNYKNKSQRLETMLKREHYLAADGRILRKPGVMPHEKPQPDPYRGDIYVLISGLTYSGGSEFASLLHNYTNAKFIGEEAGGGYYGNTSGNRIVLTLPYSKLIIGIPILKFVVDMQKDDVPFGHGVMPNYQVQPTIAQFLSGYDAELEFAKQQIKKSNLTQN